ncbi:MAG: hypothetical protein ACM31D_04735 [Bacteroidota bacterium]
MTTPNALYGAYKLTPRQRNLVARLLSGETIHFADLLPIHRKTAMQLDAKGVLTIAAVTNALQLQPPAAKPVTECRGFEDGSRAKRVGTGRWTVLAPVRDAAAFLECRAALFAASANARLAAARTAGGTTAR